MKRYYLCDLVESTDPDTGERMVNPAVASLGVNFAAVCPERDPVSGEFTRADCLVLVDAQNHGALLSHARLDALPDLPLTARQVPAGARNALNAALARRGMQGAPAGAAEYRDVIRAIGRQLSPTFDVSSFHVSD